MYENPKDLAGIIENQVSNCLPALIRGSTWLKRESKFKGKSKQGLKNTISFVNFRLTWAKV